MNLAKSVMTTLVLAGGMTVLHAQFAQTNIFSGTGLAIPDGDGNGIQDIRSVTSDIAQITSVKVRLKITGKFNGDLYVYLRHDSGSSTHLSVLLNRPGRTTANIYGYSDSGFDVTLADTAANDIHSYRNQTNPPAGTPLFGTWQPDARFVDPEIVTVDFPRSAFLNVFNGAGASGEWTLFLADIDTGGKNFLDSWGLELTGRAKPVVTWTNPVAISYGAALGSSQLNATADVPGTFVYSPPAGTILAASNHYPLSVTFLPDDTNRYAVAVASVSLDVTPVALTVSADNQTRSYGATNPPLTGTLTGALKGDSLTAAFHTTAATNSPVGDYPITPLFFDPDGRLANYSVLTNTGTLTVTPAVLDVSADPKFRSYGATNPVFTATFTGFVNGESLTNSEVAGTPFLATQADTNSPPGLYEIINNPGSLSATNYTFSFTNGTLTVTAAAITVTADNQSRSYGNTNPALTFSYAGFINGDTAAVISGSPALDVAADTNSPAGIYSITNRLGSLTATNYAFTLVNGTLSVTQASLSITANNTNKVYDGMAFSGGNGVTYHGFMNGETTTVLGGGLIYEGSAQGATNAGSYTIVPSGLTATNYAIGYTNGTLTVTPADVRIMASNMSKVYGQTETFAGTEFTTIGLTNGDIVTSVTLASSGATNTATVGSYPVIISAATGRGLENYTLSYADGILTVTPADLGVSADNQSRAFGDTNPVFTATFTGFVNGESLTNSDVAGSPLLVTLADTNSPPGSYTITNSLGSLTATNYTFSLTNGTLTVAAAIITVMADNQSRSYGDTNPVLTASYTGFINGDTAAVLSGSPVLSVGAGTNSPVGFYIITNSLGSLTATNYAFTLINGTLNVTPVALTVSADNQTRTYGATNPPLTGTLTGALNGDSLTAAFHTTAATNSPVGDYPITPLFFDPDGRLANYSVLTNNGILTITKAVSMALLSSSADPALPGSTVTFTVSLTALAPSSGTPSGMVQFKIDGADYEDPVTLAGGSASLSTATLPAGEHTVSIDYAGDENFLGATAVLDSPQVINTPPVANADVIARVPTQGARVPVSVLLANDSDADGNTVVLDSVNTNSSAGGTLSQTAGWVYYTPPAGFTNDDSFTYTERDGLGGFATGVVTVNVLADRKPAASLTILNLGNGAYQIISSGVPLGNYSIEFTEGPLNLNWGIIAVGTADSLGNFVADDAATNGIQARFYRSVYEGDGAISLPFHLNLTSSANPALPGSSVTFTLNLTTLSTNTSTPSGTVQFKVDGAAYGDPVVMAGGSAGLTTGTLPLGGHSVSAEYSGDSNYRSATLILGHPQVINSPPLVGGDVIERNPFSGTKALMTDLLANDSDPDGDALALQNLGSSTAEGGTINLAEGWIFYTPPAGFVNADSFTYTVRDSLGATATATVEIVPRVSSGEPSVNLTLTDLGGGTYRIVFSGIPWRTYTIQYTESMELPNWQSIASRTADSQGRFEYEDTLPSGTPSRFYRCVSQFAGATASPFRLAVWTNFVGQTNGRTMEMWSERTYPTGWPNTPPVLAWNTNCLLYGLEGFTGISQCQEREGAPGQVPMTLLTRRHAYLRGHSTGTNGLSTDNAGSRVWFCTANNTVVQMTIAAHFTRVGNDGAGNYYDYGIVAFTDDVPASISPVSVMSAADMEIYYSNTPDLPYLFLGTEQLGHCAAGVPPFVYPLLKGGDSGSPDMVPSPDNKLVMFTGRGTSGISAQMQADIDTLSIFEGLNPNDYQLQWYDLSPWAP